MEALNIQIAFFHFQSEAKHQVLKVFAWEVGTVQPMHCRCIFAFYSLSFLLESLIKFIKDTTGFLHYGRARTESINFSFVPNKMERGNDRSDASWQTLIWFWKSVSWVKILSAPSVFINEKQIQAGNWESWIYPVFLLTQDLLCWKGCCHTERLCRAFSFCSFLGLSLGLLPNSTTAYLLICHPTHPAVLATS